MKKLKLSNLEKQTLSQKEMNLITGGEGLYCGCACHYQGTPGGSSINSNAWANADIGISSPKWMTVQMYARVLPELVVHP